MPATKTKHRKRVSQKKKKVVPEAKLATPVSLGLAALGGAVLGLSAPGLNFWYTAWFGLVPLFLLVMSADGVKQAFLRGLVFGTAYNLVYASWLLHLHPLDWLGFGPIESVLVSSGAWFFASLHQGVITAIFCAVARFLPLCGGFLPRQVEGGWKLPSLVLLPLLWVLIHNKICNAPDVLGVPWTMLEYSQYQQLPLIQIASIIGGVGLSFFIVLTNTALAGAIATFSQKLSLKSLAAYSQAGAMTHILAIGLILAANYAWGLSKLSEKNAGANVPLSVVQGNINIEMQKTTHRYTLEELLAHYAKLVERCPAGLVVWTESALPAYLKTEKGALNVLADLSTRGKHEMIIGSLDRDFDGHPFNSAFGIAADGKLSQAVYHKRYLVPFGEYTPKFVDYMPEWIRRLTNTPAGVGFASGKIPVVLNLSGQKIAPLICFETMSPELVASSVRNGGELIVNLSDLAWFHQSFCGEQMTAFSVLRAIENGRYFVFAANTGPSVIIDPLGHISAKSNSNAEAILTGNVAFHNDYTPFTLWFY